MPTYGYLCSKCENKFEVFHSMKCTDIHHCPKCNGAGKKLLSAGSIIFKGSGFYSTDYRDSGYIEAQKRDGSTTSASTSSASSPSTTTSTSSNKEASGTPAATPAAPAVSEKSPASPPPPPAKAAA